jgi:ornithine carbamoyltransferase
MQRDFLGLADLSSEQIRDLLDLAIALKRELRAGGNSPRLAGLTLGMVFQKPSLRTRVSFDVGMAQLGGVPSTSRPTRSAWARARACRM